MRCERIVVMDDDLDARFGRCPTQRTLLLKGAMIFLRRLTNINWRLPVSLLLLAALFALAIEAKTAKAADGVKKKIVFIAGGPSHGFLAHDFLAGSRLLADRINAVPGFEATVYYGRWPQAEAFDGVAAVVIYADGDDTHIAIPHKEQLIELSRKGVGIGAIHFAVEVPKKVAGQAWLDMIGGYFETFYSVNPYWLGQFKALPPHPVTNGVKPFQMNDEWYYHMRFRERMKGVQPILSAIPPDETRTGKDDARGGNSEVRAGIGKNTLEHVFWVSENFIGGAAAPISRGFGCTGGHSHQNWAHDEFRKLVLNAIIWIAGGDVPKDGIESRRPDVDELLSNRDPGVPDEQIPPNFDRAKLADEIAELNKPYDPRR
jgi:hypothetical protein